eukprot:6003584-Prymnesium_polylepis.1
MVPPLLPGASTAGRTRSYQQTKAPVPWILVAIAGRAWPPLTDCPLSQGEMLFSNVSSNVKEVEHRSEKCCFAQR